MEEEGEEEEMKERGRNGREEEEEEESRRGRERGEKESWRLEKRRSEDPGRTTCEMRKGLRSVHGRSVTFGR